MTLEAKSIQPWADSPYPLIETPSKTQNTNEHSSIWIATEMCHVHNMFIRALNSIYHQAPHVRELVDIKDLLSYCNMTMNMIELHHQGEEKHFFPDIEEYTGKKDLMEGNIDQHHAFYPGLHAFRDYCQQTKPEDFSADTLLRIMSDFAPVFQQHLTDEIQTLLQLREYDSAEIMKIFKKTEKHALDSGSWNEMFPLAVGLVDNTFEGGVHKFPPLPWFARYIIRYWYGSKHAGAWRFNPCDFWGNPRPLLFTRK